MRELDENTCEKIDFEQLFESILATKYRWFGVSSCQKSYLFVLYFVVQIFHIIRSIIVDGLEATYDCRIHVQLDFFDPSTNIPDHISVGEY